MRQPIRVTTDPEYYEENSESVELWSPGNLFVEAPGVDLHTFLPGEVSHPLTTMVDCGVEDSEHNRDS